MDYRRDYLYDSDTGPAEGYHDPDAMDDDDDYHQKKPCKKRVNLACTRCRKRKIKCSGPNENYDPCHSCRALSDPSCCSFDRVASEKMELYSDRPEPKQLSAIQYIEPSPSYSAPSSRHDSFALCSPPAYDTSYAYTYVGSGQEPSSAMPYMASLPVNGQAQGPYGSQSWGYTNADDPSLYDMQGGAQYQSYYGPQRTSAESMSALNMTSLHSSLPVADRHLPNPSFVMPSGTPSSHSLRRSIASNNAGTSTSRRQSSIHDLAHVSSLMPHIPQVSRLPSLSMQDTPSLPDNGESTYGHAQHTRSHVPTPPMTTTGSSSYGYYTVLPPLTTSSMTAPHQYEMLPPTSLLKQPIDHHSPIERRVPETGSYSWRPATTSRSSMTDSTYRRPSHFGPVTPFDSARRESLSHR